MKIKTIKYGEKLDARINLALGYFDSLHYGHARLIAEAAADNTKTAVCIMDKLPSIVLGGNKNVIHNLNERLYRLDALGVDYAIIMHTNADTLNMSGEEFISGLINNCNVDKIIIGDDYTCGKAGAFKAADVRKEFNVYGKECIIIPLLNFELNGDLFKISSSAISNYIIDGNVKQANRLMPLPYMIMGQVVSGRQIGGKEVYPTANIEIDNFKLLPKDGVYSTVVELEGKRYKSITNIGFKPTFDEYTRTIETYLLNYNGNLYGKFITLFFLNRIRDIIKFPNASALKSQIDKDILEVLNDRNINNFLNI